MPDLGNVWHIPDSPEPRGLAGMRDPVGAIVPGTALRVVTGNQFQGSGTPGNQLQDGSLLFFKTAAEPTWQQSPFLFFRTQDNNKYYSAALPTDAFQPGDDVQYYARIPYSDHDITFVFAQAGGSATTADEATAQARPLHLHRRERRRARPLGIRLPAAQRRHPRERPPDRPSSH